MHEGKSLYGIIGIAAVAVTLAAFGLYFMVSSRSEQAARAGAMPGGTTTPPMTGTAVPPAAVPSIEAAAEGLALRLRAKDGTGDEWALLARSYVQMKRYPEAVEAYGKALQKMPGDQALIDEQGAARKSADSATATK